MAPRDTRLALLDAGIALFLEGGFEYAGTATILARARAPRGSFYHHFEDKRAFAQAVATHYLEVHLVEARAVLEGVEQSPLARLRRYFEGLRRARARDGYESGCLLGMLGQELASRDEASREVLERLFRRWGEPLAACLAAAMEAGELDRSTSPTELAAFLLDAWEGALLRMKLTRSRKPLDAFFRFALPAGLRSNASKVPRARSRAVARPTKPR